MKITDELLYLHAAEARDIWLSTLPGENDIPEFQCSRRFERKMGKLLAQQRRSRRANHFILYAKRSVAVALAAIIITFSGLMTVEAYREKIIEVIVQVFHELTDYRYYSNVEDRELPDVEFGFVPEDMVETTRDDFDRLRSVLFESSTGSFFELSQFQIQPGDSFGQIHDTEDSVIENFEINGNEAVANTKGEISTIVWTEHNVLYQLYGNIDLSTMKKIAIDLKIIYN